MKQNYKITTFIKSQLFLNPLNSIFLHIDNRNKMFCCTVMILF